MSEPPQIPRLLATLLGVEPSPPSGPPRSVAPPVGAPVPTHGGSIPVGTRGRAGREAPEAARQRVTSAALDPERTDATSQASAPRRSPSRAWSPRTETSAVRTSVRQVLASREALRAGVVVAELLGSPRALRPYGSDDRF